MIVSKSTTAINNKSSSSTHQSVSIMTGKPVMLRCLLSVAIASSLLLVGCGDDNDFDAVIGSDSATSVKSISSFNTAQINTQFGLDGTATPDAKCDIKIEKVSYPTVGAAGERTNATAALMLPSGDSADCQGDRPILLYAHGTTTDKGYDFSQVANPQNPAAGEATLIAANFAAQGYIVVAPNYAGYDESDLDYHPYLVAEQQATDMADALDSARTIIARQQRANDPDYTNLDDSGKLFISGYSQGGHVAMATARMFEQNDEPVTAIAPLSGPYALAAFGDAIFSGNVNIGASRFAPLLASGLQNAYGNVYNSTADIFTANYANTQLPSLLSFGELVAANKLPDNALFEKDPENNPTLDLLPAPTVPFASIGFADDNYLIKTDFRTAYVADALQNPDSLIAMTGALPAANPQNNLRKALKANDLRGYVPKMPTLLCGGNQDPTVFYDLNTSSMAAIIQGSVAQNPALTVNVTVLDVDATTANDRPDNSNVQLIGQASMNQWNINSVVASVQSNFVQNLQRVVAAGAEQGIPASVAVLGNYHGGLVSTACTQATREFFNQEFKPA
ncbi:MULTISPECIES: alpha/beta hydrolase family protein [unclassified Psychrobacter]|uniref:alpha/beta hydrolase family protein n=1 Tax=unclassified Psychrobacter TaxID=196806 RepID=UPI000EC39D4E|nr:MULTISPECIES: alpha/beta hydrolase [unclassified Psychrobacter]MBE8608727.1 alpha/beta hydrolase [Pseudomonas lundensis]HCI75101.1 alpha/beta hydrolase [Psychrobacter sp.]